MAPKKYTKLLKTAQEKLDYWSEIAVLEFTEDLARLIAEKGLTQAEFAKCLGTSAAYVSRVLNGNVNFTLASMTKFARALDCSVHIHLADERAVVTWSAQPSESVPQGAGVGTVEWGEILFTAVNSPSGDFGVSPHPTLLMELNVTKQEFEPSFSDDDTAIPATN